MNKTVTDLSGGMNTRSSSLKIKDNECELILNYSLDTIGALTKRNGYDTFADQPVAGKSILGIFQAEKMNTPANSNPIMVANNSGDTQSVIYENVSGTWTSRNTASTASLKTRFSEFIDYTFRVNGTNTVLTSTDLVTWGTTNAPTVITPKYTSIFQDRVYFANGNASNTRSRFWFSDLPSSGTITWDTANNFVDVNPDDGDEITALENNGNRLLIFKNRAMYRWTYGQVDVDRVIGVGTKSQECVKTNLDVGLTFFANERGAYSTDGGRAVLISRKIQKWFDAVPIGDVDDFQAEVDSDHYYLYLSDSLTVDGRTYTNVMAVYNIPLDAWVIYTLNVPVRAMARVLDSSQEIIVFGSTNGRCYEFNSGTADDSGGANGDTATPINAEVEFKEHLLEFPEKTRIKYVDVISTQHVASSVGYKLDRNGKFIPLGGLTERITVFPITSEKHIRTAQIKITDASQNTSIIEGYNIEHEPTKLRK